MHYSLLVLTEKLPTKKDLDKILAPYNDDKLYDEKNDTTLVDTLTSEEMLSKFPFTWDWYQIGGRYGGNIKYKMDADDYKYYNHNLNHKKFISTFFDNLQKKDTFFDECNYAQYLGTHDNIIYCDGAYIKSIKNIKALKDFGCYIIDKNKKVFYREAWNGNEFIKNKNYSNELVKILDEQGDCFLTILDIHN